MRKKIKKLYRFGIIIKYSSFIASVITFILAILNIIDKWNNVSNEEKVTLSLLSICPLIIAYIGDIINIIIECYIFFINKNENDENNDLF